MSQITEHGTASAFGRASRSHSRPIHKESTERPFPTRLGPESPVSVFVWLPGVTERAGSVAFACTPAGTGRAYTCRFAVGHSSGYAAAAAAAVTALLAFGYSFASPGNVVEGRLCDLADPGRRSRYRVSDRRLVAQRRRRDL